MHAAARRIGLAAAVIGLTIGGAGQARADLTLWNESVNGDLSNDQLQPTPIGTLGVGNNLVVGSLVNDEDNFTFTVGTGLKFDGIILTDQSGGGSPNFFLSPGSSFSSSNLIGDLNWSSSNVAVGITCSILPRQVRFTHRPQALAVVPGGSQPPQ